MCDVSVPVVVVVMFDGCIVCFEQALMAAVAQQPVSIAIEADEVRGDIQTVTIVTSCVFCVFVLPLLRSTGVTMAWSWFMLSYIYIRIYIIICHTCYLLFPCTIYIPGMLFVINALFFCTAVFVLLCGGFGAISSFFCFTGATFFLIVVIVVVVPQPPPPPVHACHADELPAVLGRRAHGCLRDQPRPRGVVGRVRCVRGWHQVLEGDDYYIIHVPVFCAVFVVCVARSGGGKWGLIEKGEGVMGNGVWQ